MAERVMVVCDVCGEPAVLTVAITANDRSYRKDLCAEHLAELLRGTRAPKRGRPTGIAAPAATATPAATAAPAATGTPKRRGRPPKAKVEPATETSTNAKAAKRPRRRITDPVILEKRRAALVKARQARAAKRSAAAALTT
jgi:hypothetical protein